MDEEQRRILRRVIKDGLRIQHRFKAEPVLAQTGKGYLKSEGVETLLRIKASMKNSARRKLKNGNNDNGKLGQAASSSIK